MNLIICEGKTDAVFIGYYLSKKYGWSFDKGKSSKSQTLKMDDSQHFCMFEKDGRELGIWSVGGCDNFCRSIGHLVKYIETSGEPVERVLYMIDRDSEKNDGELLKIFDRTPHCDITTEWKDFLYIDKFDRNITFKALVLIIPAEETGALETVFLNALKNRDPEAEIIVEKTSAFVDSFELLGLKKYLTKNRERLKAKFLTVISLMHPVRAFQQVDELIKSFDWHESDEINELFKVLGSF